MQQDISPLEKYALKFYLVIVHQILAVLLLVCTHNVHLFTSYIGFVFIIGYYFPVDDADNTKYLQEQNRRKWALIPVIMNCLATPVALYFVWNQYNNLVQESFANGFTLVFGMGLLLSPSINASHELLHRQQIICSIACYINLYFIDFTVYPVQHLYLHHKKVGTPEDPITAPKNQNLYNYYVNAIISAYKFNYSFNKRVFFKCVLATVSHNLLIVLFAFKEGSGIGKIILFIAITYFTLLSMEATEYLEHYGLVYRASQKAKPVTQICSWNAKKNLLANLLVFRFQRHSDHHMNAYKLYNTLDLTQKMPQFPFDFVSANFVSMLPPVWKWIANPLVDEVIQGKKVDPNHIKNVKLFMNIFRSAAIMNFVINLAQQFANKI